MVTECVSVLDAHCSAPSLNDIPSLPTQYAPLQIYPLCSFSPSLRLNEGRHSHQSGLGSSLGVWCGRVASPADLVPVSLGLRLHGCLKTTGLFLPLVIVLDKTVSVIALGRSSYYHSQHGHASPVVVSATNDITVTSLTTPTTSRPPHTVSQY